MNDVMEKIKELGDLYKGGQYRQCIEEIANFWSKLPEPKESAAHSYLIVEYGARISLLLNDFDNALQWAFLGLKYNEIRSDLGQSEFLIGKVAFEKGDIDTAKRYLAVAQEKSNGRAFHGEDPKYKNCIG